MLSSLHMDVCATCMFNLHAMCTHTEIRARSNYDGKEAIDGSYPFIMC